LGQLAALLQEQGIARTRTGGALFGAGGSAGLMSALRFGTRRRRVQVSLALRPFIGSPGCCAFVVCPLGLCG
jgi:hypothetical protein